MHTVRNSFTALEAGYAILDGKTSTCQINYEFGWNETHLGDVMRKSTRALEWSDFFAKKGA